LDRGKPEISPVAGLAGPKKFAHIGQELSIDPKPETEAPLDWECSPDGVAAYIGERVFEAATGPPEAAVPKPSLTVQAWDGVGGGETGAGQGRGDNSTFVKSIPPTQQSLRFPFQNPMQKRVQR
jgi:hypothetical protein